MWPAQRVVSLQVGTGAAQTAWLGPFLRQWLQQHAQAVVLEPTLLVVLLSARVVLLEHPLVLQGLLPSQPAQTAWLGLTQHPLGLHRVSHVLLHALY